VNATRHWSGCIALLGALTLPGCAWLSPPPAPSGAVQALPASWAVAGRLGVKAAGKGSYANFDWKRQAGGDIFDITTPLGQTVARLSRDASGVRLISAWGNLSGGFGRATHPVFAGLGLAAGQSALLAGWPARPRPGQRAQCGWL